MAGRSRGKSHRCCSGARRGRAPYPQASGTLSQREAHEPSDSDSNSGEESLTEDPKLDNLPDKTRLAAMLMEGAVDKADPSRGTWCLLV